MGLWSLTATRPHATLCLGTVDSGCSSWAPAEVVTSMHSPGQSTPSLSTYFPDTHKSWFTGGRVAVSWHMAVRLALSLALLPCCLGSWGPLLGLDLLLGFYCAPWAHSIA